MHLSIGKRAISVSFGWRSILFADVEYKFYLGGDLVTDYNIYRDYHYKLTVNIAGPNSADLRVTITNGNVAVFDDVDNVENTVNFGEEK